MQKSTFLKNITRARIKYQAALAIVRDDQMELAGASGDMSVKDIIGHVAWYEREMVDLLKTGALEGSALWGAPPADRNAAIMESLRAASSEDIQEEADEVYDQLLELLEDMDEAALEDPAHFKNMPADWVPWKVISENSTEHYEDHADDILSWLAKQ